MCEARTYLYVDVMISCCNCTLREILVFINVVGPLKEMLVDEAFDAAFEERTFGNKTRRDGGEYL